MTYLVAYVCPYLLHYAKDFSDQKYYSGNVVESCQDMTLYTVKSLISDHTVELYNNVCTAFDGTVYYFFCTKCIYMIRMRHSYHNIFRFVENGTGHD